MREILFRGKRVDNGEWIIGDLITTPFIRNETQQHIIYILDITKADYDSFEDLTEDNGIFEVEPETVCQYTGLTDKNGRKIFEGDIVTIPYTKKQGLPAEVGYMSREAMFCIKRIGYAPIRLEDSDTWCEVVGNIFDNPGLIRE